MVEYTNIRKKHDDMLEMQCAPVLCEYLVYWPNIRAEVGFQT